jgi:hypothetical protein
MENWQLTLVILASVFVGSLIPLFVMTARALYRAGRELAEISGQLKRTLSKIELISFRAEVLSRGFEGKETAISDLLESFGHLAHGIERNMKIVNLFSTIVTSLGMVIAAFFKARVPVKETEKPLTPDDVEESPNKPPQAKPPVHDQTD